MTDGTYSASSRGKHAPVTVEVTVSGGKISDIKISEHSEMPGMVESIEKDMLPLIVEHQTLNVDNVTAATVTSSAVLLAVADALGQAGFDVDALYDADYAAPVYEAPETTDADVIVIGAGGAGMNAALTAAAAGKSVIILEKLPSIGGNTQVSGGGMAAPCNWLQQEEGIEDSPELFEQDIITGGDDTDQDHDLVHVLAFGALEAAEWLRDEHGVVFDHLNFFGGHSVMRSLVPKGESGAQITWPLKNDCEKAGIPIYRNMRATEFVMNDDGSVAAVKAQNPAGDEFEFTGKAFVLASGGFGGNLEMRMKWDPTLDENVKSTDTVGTTGDGITMAEAIGAGFVGMKWIQTYPTCDPITGALLYIYDVRLMDRGILVNEEGNRFVEELERRDVHLQRHQGPDRRLRLHASLTRPASTRPACSRATLARSRCAPSWAPCSRATRIAEVAEAAGVDAAGLEATRRPLERDVRRGRRRRLQLSLQHEQVRDRPVLPWPLRPGCPSHHGRRAHHRRCAGRARGRLHVPQPLCCRRGHGRYPWHQPPGLRRRRRYRGVRSRGRRLRR